MSPIEIDFDANSVHYQMHLVNICMSGVCLCVSASVYGCIMIYVNELSVQKVGGGRVLEAIGYGIIL